MGLSGTAKTGAGVVGASGDMGTTFIDFSRAGVGGFSKTGAGVVGFGPVGGVFIGAKAAISLVPGARSTHPVKGDRGDLYVDKTGRLWYCRTSGRHATWHQLA